MKPFPKKPRGYPGKFPPPPHIPVEKKIAAFRELAARPEKKETPFLKAVLFFIGSRILTQLVKIVYYTCRIRYFYIDPKAMELIEDASKQFIIAMWHNRLFYTVYSIRQNVCFYGHDVLAIISESDDAEFVARSTEHWGAFAARGSSTRGGAKALKKILSYVKLHFHPLITPDGPRGPVYEMKEGLPIMARLTGLPIIPFCSDAKSKWVFSSWDRFIMPKPFSKVVIHYGEPIHLPRDMELADAQKLLREKMMAQVELLEKKLTEI